MTKENLMVVSTAIIACETGGQIYGKGDWSSCRNAIPQIPGEKTITLGAAGFYGSEARDLLNRIYKAAPELVPADIKAILSVDLVATRWTATDSQIKELQSLISTDVGVKCQKEQLAERVATYVSECVQYYPDTLSNPLAQAYFAEIRHLGGLAPVRKHFDRISTYTEDAILESLKRDQEDTSNNNQVGDSIFWSRHTAFQRMMREHLERGYMIINYKQTDPRWSGSEYAAETMAAAGCGPTAVADLIGVLPTEIARWLSDNGYASNGYGTYQSGITTAVRAYGYDCKQITVANKAGVMSDPSFETFKSHIKAGYCGILLMGGQLTGCRNSYWSRSGHFIAVVGYSSTADRYLVYDPAYDARDGYHDWADFAGNIKHVYTTGVRWASTGKGSVKVSAKKSTTYSFKAPQIKPGLEGVPVLLLQEILKARGIYTGGLDRSYGPATTKAVKALQKSQKIKQDGICGPTTWSNLLALPKETSGLYVLKQIKQGDKGVEVLLLQEILKARGLYSGKLDRDFGPNTKKALVAYQTQRKLAVDGICGPASWKDLIAL